MELLQHLQGQQLAWQGRADYLLDGEALDAGHGRRVRDRGRRGCLSLESVEYVGYAGEFWGEGEEGAVEEDQWEGSV